MKPIWIVLLCLLGAAVLAALVWLLVWYVGQRVLCLLYTSPSPRDTR